MRSQGFRNSGMGRGLTLAALLGSTMLAGPALAQDAEEASVVDNAIIVTAQRRSEALEDVPMSIAIIPQETLAAAGVNSVRDLANVTTGFQVNQGGSYPQPAIRGITTINAGSYENNVALFVDGLYQTTPQILNMDLPNVNSIQILKGPQGTLYGRNATGGAILIDTIDPGDVWAGNAEVTYGRFDDKRARAYLSGPLTEGVGLSVSGTVRQTDGYYKRASRTTPGETDGRFLGLKQTSFRMKLKVDVTPGLTATLGYNFLRASDPRGVVFSPIENVQAPYTPGTGNATRPRELGVVAGDFFDLDLRQHEASLKLEWDTGIGTLRSVTGYTAADLDTTFDFGGSYVPDSYSDSRIYDRTLQQNIDFNIDAIENFNLILGGNYYEIKTQFAPQRTNSFFFGPAFHGIPGNTNYLRSTDTQFYRTKEAWAVFADATFQATDRLSINVGGRYSKETQDVSGYKVGYSLLTGQPTSCLYSREGETRFGLTCALPTAPGNPPGNPSARTSSYKKFTPRASIRYEITPGTNIYASYSQGFRGGEWNSVIPGDNPANWTDADQESVTAYEIGLKSAGRRLRFEIAGFYYDYTDLQVSFTQSVNNVALVTLQNAPSAEIYGAEASFDYEVIDNLKIRGGATYLHARYGDDFFFTGSGVNPNLAGFNTNSDPLKTFRNETLEQDLSGLQMARAPKFSAFLGFDYLIPNQDGGLRIAANAKYTDSYVVTNPSVWGGEPGTSLAARRAAANDPTLAPNNDHYLGATPYADRANEQRARQGKHVLLNASVTWTDPTDHYYVRIWGNNLTDVKYKTHYNPLGGGTYAPIGEPLTYGATIGYKF